jgi:tRNA pseudouridine55 synthase
VNAPGLLLIDKPAGVTSHDVVNAARRALGEKRIGHAGTLDPFATGLLVLLVGQATRLLPYVSGDPKVYAATVRFGAETDTEDLLGAVVREAAPPGEPSVRAALPSLTGTIEQLPPAYSAKRVAGRRAYELARAGETVALAPVPVRVDAWDLLAWRDRRAGRVRRASDVRPRHLRPLAGPRPRSRRGERGTPERAPARAQRAVRRRQTPRRSTPCVRATCVSAPRSTPFPTIPHRRSTRPTCAAPPAATGSRRPSTGPWASLVDAATGALVALAERAGAHWQPRVVLNG